MTTIGEPKRERVIQPEVIPVPHPRREISTIPDHLPDEITAPELEPAAPEREKVPA
jgi:hypothetical protein